MSSIWYRQAQPTLDAALRDLGAPREDDRLRAVSSLARCSPERHEVAREALSAVLRDQSPRVREELALALGCVGDDSSMEDLEELLGDSVPAVRQQAAIALGTLGLAGGFDCLLRALQEGPPDLRFQAATSLAEVQPTKAAPHLANALATEEDPQVLSALALSVAAVGAPSAERLAELCTHSDPGLVFDASYALAQLGDERGIEGLAESVREPSDSTWDAIEALESLRGARAAVALEPALTISHPHRLRLRGAGALLRLRPDCRDAQVTLLGGLRLRRLEDRGLTLSLLAEVGRLEWARGPLEKVRSKWSWRRLRADIDETLERIAE